MHWGDMRGQSERMTVACRVCIYIYIDIMCLDECLKGMHRLMSAMRR